MESVLPGRVALPAGRGRTMLAIAAQNETQCIATGRTANPFHTFCAL